MRLTQLALLVVAALPSLAAAQQVPAVLANARIESTDGAVVPRSVRVRRSGTHRIGTVPNRAVVYQWAEDGTPWETKIVGATLPAGTRLLPVRGLETIRFASLPPEGYAVLLPGSSVAWIYDFMESTPSPLPLESAVPGVPARQARAATVELRAMRSCPVSRSSCVLYGPPRDVLRAQDPDEPLGGFYLRPRVVDAAPAGVTYTTTRSDTTIAGVGLRFDVGRSAADELIRRVFVVVGGNETLAFTTVFRGSILAASDEGITSAGAHLYVYGHGGRVSVHERATGRRVAQHGAVDYDPYYEVCLAGDDGIFVLPVLDGANVGYALFFEGANDAVYYPTLPGPARRVPLSVDFDELYGEHPLHLRVTGPGLSAEPAAATTPR